MRKQPVTVFAILILASIGLALSGCAKKQASPSQQMEQGAQKIGEGVKNGASNAAESVKQGAQKMGESVKGAASKAGEVMSDSTITAKIKSELAANQGLSSFDIHVSTDQGVVTLTGTVDMAASRDLAGNVAKDTNGVKSVDNKIEVSKDN